MENFIVSALKYRPGLFKEVVGQDHITNTLKKAIKSQRFAHSYLFCGPRGIGKTTCARILAKAINCQNLTDEGEPCNECESCQRFQESSSFNIYELDAASNNKVEHIRSLIEQVRFPPQSGKYKIYVIDEVHMLTQSAFNAFLKTLEEPPEYAIFILATTEKQKILPTILSRCQIFDFRRIQVEDIVNHLQKVADEEGVEAEQEALHIIAQKADGALRDALSLFDKIVSFADKKVTYQAVIDNLNILDYDYYFKMTEAILSQNVPQALQIFNEIISKGFEGDVFVNGLSSHFRDLLVCKDVNTLDLLDVSGNLRERYQQQAELAPPSFLINALQITNECDVGYQASKNKRLHVEMALIKLCYLQGEPSAVEKSGASEKQTSTKQSKKNRPNDKEKLNQSSSKSVKPKRSEDNSSSDGESGQKPTSSYQSDQQNEQKGEKKVQEPPSNKMGQRSENGQQQKEGKATRSNGKQSPPSRNLRQDALQKQWKNFLNKASEQQKGEFFQAFIKNTTPTKVDGQTFKVPVQHGIEKQRLNEEKTPLLEFLREKLEIPSLRMQIEVQEDQQSSKKAYTSKEKFREMAKRNPNLKKLKRKLDLDIEY